MVGLGESRLAVLKKKGEAPEWMHEHGYRMLSKGYLQKGETPKDMYTRIAAAAAKRLMRPDWFDNFFDIMWKGWLCPATPVASNMGTTKGLPISCYGLYVPDSINGIGSTIAEMKALAKGGGGLGVYWGGVRGRGEGIGVDDNGHATLGHSEGVMPFIKEQDAATHATNQGSTRRGASSAYLPIEHPDIKEFLYMRKPQADHNKECGNIHHGVTITDEFMKKVYDGDKEATELFTEVLMLRLQTGEPYICFVDNANRHLPISYVLNDLKVLAPQLCTEIFLYMDEWHTYVCCLSSMNLLRWDEWKDTDAVYWATIMLDGVMQEFIEKVKVKMREEKEYSHLWRRVFNFAKKSRALGLGALGWHSLLQSKMIPFDSFQAMMLNGQIFKHLDDESLKATKFLAEVYGEPEWCKGTGHHNSHRLAVAPTRSNSVIAGDTGKGIEPEEGNAYLENAAKGSFDKRNKYLEAILEEIGENTPETWASIVEHHGSVQHLDFLDDHTKDVFKTAYEINQFAIIKQAAQRQKYIDQGQSVNLFFPEDVDASYIMQVHLAAHLQGLKSLYYCKSKSVAKGDIGSRGYKREYTECASCEG
jgi:ribonucleoside-diphosphate reductase alpha chain